MACGCMPRVAPIIGGHRYRVAESAEPDGADDEEADHLAEQLDAEDAKLAVLARAAMARAGRCRRGDVDGPHVRGAGGPVGARES